MKIEVTEKLKEQIRVAIKHSYDSVGYGYVLNEVKLENQIVDLIANLVVERINEQD